MKFQQFAHKWAILGLEAVTMISGSRASLRWPTCWVMRDAAAELDAGVAFAGVALPDACLRLLSGSSSLPRLPFLDFMPGETRTRGLSSRILLLRSITPSKSLGNYVTESCDGMVICSTWKTPKRMI